MVEILIGLLFTVVVWILLWLALHVVLHPRQSRKRLGTIHRPLVLPFLSTMSFISRWVGWAFGYASPSHPSVKLPAKLSKLLSRFLDEVTISQAVVLFVLLALFFFTLGVMHGESFSANLATELASLAITVLVIDTLNRRRTEQQEKQHIIEQISSPSNAFAVEAIRIARTRGWLDEALRKANLCGANLAGADLHKANLSGLDLSNANLSNASLRRADLSNSQLFFADLTDANLEKADLYQARLRFATLNGANLSNADLSGAQLGGAKFVETKLSFTTLHDADLGESDFRQARFFFTDLRAANLRKADLSGTELPSVQLAKADLDQADLTGTDLRQAELDSARLTNIWHDEQTQWPEGFVLSQ